MSDNYRTVTFKLRGIGANVFRIEVKNRPGVINLPRSLVHGADQLTLSRMSTDKFPVKVTARVFEWKAEELGLA